MARRVEIRWSNPCKWDSRSASLNAPDTANATGIYQLTRVWAGYEQLLYIGIVWADTRTMLERMADHRKKWLGVLRGINYRFGVITPLRGLTRDRYLLETIEGALIYELQPPENDKKKSSYSSYGDLFINNRGNRGAIPKYVDMSNH
jgi:hypothetical protein